VDFPVNDLSAMKIGKKNSDLLVAKAAYSERRAVSCRSGDIVPGLHGGNFRLNSATLASARRTPPAQRSQLIVRTGQVKKVLPLTFTVLD